MGLHCYAVGTHADELVFEPPPKKNPGSAYDIDPVKCWNFRKAIGIAFSFLQVNPLREFHLRAQQLVKYRAHKTRNRESTRLGNKVSDLWKVPKTEGNSISSPFMPGEFAFSLIHLELGKSPRLDSIFPEFILHAGSAFKSWLCDFFTSCMRQLKIPRIWRRALVPKAEKPLRDPKS